MEYVVYCDESRHDGCEKNPFLAIGGLWVPAERKPTVSREFRDLCRSKGLNGEVKWSKISKSRLDAYHALVAYFLERSELSFRVIVVEQAKVDYESFHGGDKELGFYKFYYEMLIKWIEPGNQYLLLLDFKQNKGADRYGTLKRVLERATMGKSWIKDLTVIDSGESPLAQLCDLLTGAVAATWCGAHKVDSAKGIIARQIAEGVGFKSLKEESPSPGSPKGVKFNVFRIHLAEA